MLCEWFVQRECLATCILFSPSCRGLPGRTIRFSVTVAASTHGVVELFLSNLIEPAMLSIVVLYWSFWTLHMLPICSPYVPRRAISFLFAWIAASLPYLACSAFLEAKIQVTACECKRDQNGPKSSWCSNYAKIIQNQIQQQTNSVVKISSELLSELHSSRLQEPVPVPVPKQRKGSVRPRT